MREEMEHGHAEADGDDVVIFNACNVCVGIAIYVFYY